MAERALSTGELNRALLARQLLLDRGTAPLPRALERVGGIQAQYAPSMYVGLWSRLDGLAREQLKRALERRAVVQGTLMRVTIHLVSRADYWPIALATREQRRAAWRRPRPGIAEEAMAEAARLLRERLQGGDELQRTEIEALVGKERAPAVGLWLDLVRVPPSGTWERRRADRYALAEDWIGPPPPDLTAEDGVDLLVRRRLGGFGPASVAAIAGWAGLPVRPVAAAVQRLALRRLRGPGGEELVDLPRAPLPAAATPAPVRYLPTWDATLLVHARGTGLLAEEHRARIFTTSNPQSVSTFLVDGRVAGTWRLDDGRVELEPFGRLDAATRRELREEGDRLAAFQA